MGIQQQLLQKLGDSLVVKFRESIAETKASGRTSASIHAVSGDYFMEVWAAESIGALIYGRKPTSEGAPKGSPSLFEIIKEWAQTKGIISGLDKKSLGIVWAITKSIHQHGTMLHSRGNDYYRKRQQERIVPIIENLNLDQLLREISVLKLNEWSSDVIKELKQIE